MLPESARGEVGGDAGLSLNSVGGLTSLVAEIAARGNPKRQPDAIARARGEKCHTGRFRRENS